MASFGALATSAIGHAHRADMLAAKADTLSQKTAAFNAGTAPSNVTADSLAKENRNLSHAQFRHRLDVANTTSQAAQSVTTTNTPSTPPSAIGPGLYS